ncbi:PVC-type heme-binding CxxCH protein [Phragmitibacter flavus]|nr:PVC-type heme-binding CxxCH protein [Phragmitibacter flavus]
MHRILFAALLSCVSTIQVAASDFPAPNDTQPLTIPFPTAKESLALMKLPPGFKATVFAAEPDVNNPIACAWDAKGRLWVAENFTYGDNNERYNLKLRDRILIFEDTDNDGVHDKRTVFTDQLQMLTSIERGLGGVWGMAPPHLLFIPDANGDDVPDGPPQVVLEGFSTEAASRHTFANGLKWGPDGWLYGRCGISSTSFIGVPGSKQEERLATAGGMWRYHPTRKVFDIVCAGTTNPWGHDWNEHGELFFINTVIGHLWHGIHGAHLKRMHGQDLNPRVYQQMEQIADHYHWDTGGSWTDSREGAKGSKGADALGGGHAHVGMMIYQGTNWPEYYRGKVFTLNMHGRRVNVEKLERNGSGYVGKHEPDILKSDDPWFRGVEITYGPDGGVYILDWSDIGECHENDGVHRNSGRIYKITYGDAVKPKEADLTKVSDEELVKLQLSDNEWLVRNARLELRERANRDKALTSLAPSLYTQFHAAPNIAKKLNNWWALRILADFTKSDHESPLIHDNLANIYRDSIRLNDPILKSWAIRSVSPAGPADKLNYSESGNLLVEIAKGEVTSTERLVLASSLKTLHPDQKVKLGAVLLARADDSNDPNLPLMYWYGIMDLPPGELVKLFADCQIPLVRKFIARRCAEDIESDPTALNGLLALGKHQADVLLGMGEALDGWAKAKKPEAWDAFAAKIEDDAAAKEALQGLSLLFGDGRAIDDIKKIALDDKADFAQRNNALQSLITAKAEGLRQICEKLLKTRGLNMTALRGLALFDDPAIGKQLALSYRNFYPNEQPVLIETLTSRKGFAKALLDQMAANKVPKTALTVIHARQIRSFKDEALDKQLAEVWGEIRESSADKQKLIADLKAKLTPEVLAKGDPHAGRVLFNMACAACHKLYGEGHLIGPDLTGSGRKDINYLIENIVDPSALLAADYRMTIVTMKDGRVLSGNVAAKSDRTLTLKMVGLEQVLELEQIANTQQLPVSLMPEGLMQAFNEEQVRDLMAYLMTDTQVELK